MAFLERPGVNLWTENFGLAPPWKNKVETIVFCHGVGTNADTWRDWLSTLTPGFNVIVFDTRGFGRSSLNADAGPWSFDTLADDILAVADNAGVGRFHLVGESLGGTISLYLGIRNPERLKTLTLASTGYRGASLTQVNAWRERIADKGMATWSSDMMTARFVDNAITRNRYEWFDRVQAGTDADALLDAADLLIGVNLEADLPKVACPVQLLAGDSSPFINLEHSLSLRDKLPDARIRVFPNARHGIVFSHARECARQVRDFIRECA